ncbi:MAG: ribonuclease P protein component [Pseudoxanthomonas sp.]
MDELPANTADACFPPAARVRAKADYGRVFDQAKRTSHPLLALHWRRAETPARLGLAVSRKVDKRAVVRNRIKRSLREVFRHLRPQLVGGDYVIVARSAAAVAANAQLAEAFVQVLRRAGALPPPAGGGTMPPVLNSPHSPTNKPESDPG